MDDKTLTKRVRKLTGCDAKKLSRFQVEFCDNEGTSLEMPELENAVAFVSGYTDVWKEPEESSFDLSVVDLEDNSVRRCLKKLREIQANSTFCIKVTGMNGENSPVDTAKFIGCKVTYVSHDGFDLANKSDSRIMTLGLTCERIEVDY